MSIRVASVSKNYKTQKALNAVSFTAEKGQIIGFLGPNGAGKSTFVRQITGVEQRTSGKVIFDGKEVHFDGPLDAREQGPSPGALSAPS